MKDVAVESISDIRYFGNICEYEIPMFKELSVGDVITIACESMDLFGMVAIVKEICSDSIIVTREKVYAVIDNKLFETDSENNHFINGQPALLGVLDYRWQGDRKEWQKDKRAFHIMKE